MNTHKPFSNLSQIVAPSHLEGVIRNRIAKLERRAFIVRAVSFVSLVLASLAGFVASCAYAWTEAVSAGFGQYASIVFSDIGAALSNFKELGLALVESLPVVGTALVLLATAALVWSLSGLVKNLIKNNRSYGFAH